MNVDAETGEVARVFLAGPMSGYPEWNFPAFDAAARVLRRHDLIVFNPAERDRATGFDPTGMTGTEDLAAVGFDLRAAMRDNLAWLCEHADAVALLDGWERSPGALAEVAVARALKLSLLNASALAADATPSGAVAS